jgi:hypothetical protein
VRKKWQVLGAQDLGEDPYLDRLRILATPFFSIYLHHIRREDYTPSHDHPWWFASLVLTGRYTELVYSDKHDPGSIKLSTNKRGSLHTMSTKARHRIVHVSRPLWTLVLTGPPTNEKWGFFPEGVFTPWQEYEQRETVVAGWPSWKDQGVLK